MQCAQSDDRPRHAGFRPGHLTASSSGGKQSPAYSRTNALFQRMLLRITNAADEYIDYASANHPFRRLEDAPPVSA